MTFSDARWIPRRDRRRSAAGAFVGVLALLIGGGCGEKTPDDVPPAAVALTPERDGVYVVRAGEDIQRALDAAARNPDCKRVRVEAGVYRPDRVGQAFLQFNAEHDGIVVEADGEVTLTAENRSLAPPGEAGSPAVVNHVVYFGDGITARTVFRGFRITGANGFVTRAEHDRPLEPAQVRPELAPHLFFYSDGGGVKIFGRSSPTLERVEFLGNRTLLCGGGISIEQRGLSEAPAVIRDCVFRDNACPGTGAAIDVLSGGRAEIVNCLFRNNIANTGMDEIASRVGLTYNAEHGCGALTVFPDSSVSVSRCTFTGNWNGADDHGLGSVYENCIFWKNTAGDGSRPGSPYEIDVLDGAGVAGCYFGGGTNDLRGTIDRERNVFNAPDPEFNEFDEPQAADYSAAGYRRPPSQTPTPRLSPQDKRP